ncbi:MAG: recombination mediator RecR [Candidatus Andersenbacteria bacterium]
MLPKAVRDLTQELTRLPGIGPKTAQRLSIYLLRQPRAVVARFADTLKNLHANVRICSQCYNLAEDTICIVCQDQMRSPKLLCVVEDALDVEAIERTNSYEGRYHVLGGVLSPLEGIGVEQLTLRELFSRVDHEQIEELIIALDHTMESEATTRHIINHLRGMPIKITRLARGLPTGGDIEFADTLTLTAALSGRKKL